MATYGEATPTAPRAARRPSTQLLRVRKGQMVSGVCSGLEASGRGSAVALRLLFALVSWFALIGVVIYVVMAIAIPYASPEEEEMMEGKATTSNETGTLDKIQTDLAKINSMKSQGLITEEEYEILRKKALGLSIES